MMKMVDLRDTTQIRKFTCMSSASHFGFGVALEQLLGAPWAPGVMFRLILLGADCAALVVLLRLAGSRHKEILVYYWLSPVILQYLMMAFFHFQHFCLALKLYP